MTIQPNTARWPTMAESAAWYRSRAIAAFRRRHDRPMMGGHPRGDARYLLRVAKVRRDDAAAAGPRAEIDPW